MKHIFTYILFFTTMNLFAQKVVVDTSYVFSSRDLLIVHDTIQSLADTKDRLTREAIVLEELRNQQTLKIKKLELRDTLCRRELDLSYQIESVLRDKQNRSNDIITNYKILLYSTEGNLVMKTKEAKRENFWKNVYKWGFPILGGVIGVLILK